MQLVEELSKYLGFYLLLEKDYFPIDKKTAQKLNKDKVNNTIWYAMDTMMIKNRLDKTNYFLLDFLWNTLSYEDKCEFINTYIDTIRIKKYYVKGEKKW